jgi:hypothetical protein
MSVPISNVTRRVVLAASGTGPYSFNFEILAATDISVYRDDTLLTLTTNYTVTINTNGTGFVTLTATPTGATQIAIVGDRAIQRTSDFTTGGDLFATTLNDELDSMTIFAQQNAEGVDRALKAPQTDPTNISMTMPRASVRAGKVLSFDSNGNPAAVDYIGENRGNWAAGIAYNQRDIVKDTTNDNIYQVLTPHTSTGSLPISTNTDSAKWALLVNAAAANASAVAAAASASAASTSASNASTSASNASTSASNASTSASNASTSASNAASSASTASTAASNAQTAETNAETAETNAETAQAAAEAAQAAAEAAEAASINLATNFTATATTLSPGASATASYNSGTYTLTLGIPTGATGSTGATGATGPVGMNWLGAYNAGTSYVVDDAVSYNGSSYICKLASTGNLPTNTTYWDVIAEKGASGSGAGDVVGPASAVNNRLVAFDGTTGKLIKDSTYTASSFEPADATILKSAAIGVSVQAYDSNLTSFVGTFTLPTTDGTADQVLKTNGSGTLSFVTPSSGITTGKAIAMAIVFGG